MTTSIKSIHVEPLTSPRTGEPVKNQYVINTRNVTAFQSYDSLIAIYNRDDGSFTLGRDWNYSVTTVKYLMRFIEDYCYSIHSQLPDGRSSGDRIHKAIMAGLMCYDYSMR